MQRLNPRSAAACSRMADDEAFPAQDQILTDDWYRRSDVRWSAALDGWECPPRMMASFDRVVGDLVDRHSIVHAERRNDLREWLKYVVCGYFGLKEAVRNQLTEKQVARCKERIDHLANELRQELVRFYRFGPDRDRDIAALDELLSRARHYEVPGKLPTWKSNASNDALHVLSGHICHFWIPRWWWFQHDLKELPFDFSKGSPCLRFAKYIYAYVGMARCTDRMIVERLRVHVREITDARQGRQAARTPRRFPGFILGSSDED